MPYDIDELFLALDDWVALKEEEGYPLEQIVSVMVDYIELTHELHDQQPDDLYRPHEKYN